MVVAQPIEKGSKAVRLDMPKEHWDRLAKQAERRGLSLASYARMAVMELIERDEKKP